jgi:hypothetical protein
MDRARDELFSHIHRCGVLEAQAEEQDSWMAETVEYLAERYPDLAVKELSHLKAVGMQFCKPVISRLRREKPPEHAAVDEDSSEALLGAPREA